MNYEQSLATPETAADRQIQQDRLNLHTALPAKVVTFDPEKQTVTLAVQIKMQLANGSGEDIPPLVDVPVSFPRGGGFAVTFPLKAGDECIAIFSERCIDGWWHSGGRRCRWISACMIYLTLCLFPAFARCLKRLMAFLPVVYPCKPLTVARIFAL